MAIRCSFLGLSQPPLQLAADFLCEQFVSGVSADMSSAIVVLPGSRAARRLLEILVERAEQRSLDLIPPVIETVGRLPEQLYQPQKPFATELAQQLAWAHVLRTAEPEQLRPILGSPPARDDHRPWLELGALLSRQHTELAADGLNFADVAQRGGEVAGFAEQTRWQALRRVQLKYLALLDDLGLWDIQTARLVAVQQRECTTQRRIILVGAVDLNHTLRSMLNQVAGRATALVFAPQDWSSRFDEFGCLLPQAWESLPLDLSTDRVHVVEGPAEQAEMAARCLADYRGQFRSDEVSVGLADETITPYLQRQFLQCGLTARSAAGAPLAQTAPVRLLAAVAEYLQRGDFAAFAALVRHPDLYDWLDQRQSERGWLAQLDEYFSEHLPSQLGGKWLGSEDAHGGCRQAYQDVTELLAPLNVPPRPLDAWNEPLRAVLVQVYGARDWDRGDPHEHLQLQALEKLNAALADHAGGRIPQRLMPLTSAAEALRMLLEQVQAATIAAPLDPAAIELLGWLELPWDDAPALVVTSFNEGYVPSSINSDLFLPNALRNRLGVQDNARRFARDAYALSVLLATRRRVDFIVARRSGAGEPLAPSRLLFASDVETIARRALAFFKPPRASHERPPLAGRLLAGRERSGFPIPLPRPLPEPMTALRVTAFRDYLACPYRFYLRHVLRLQTQRDAAAELDGAAFGGLLHAVLNDFGRGPFRDSSDPDEILAALDESLRQLVAGLYGNQPLPSIRVQVEQLRMRLAAFAQRQAEWAAGGWRIARTEVSAFADRPAGALLPDADSPMIGAAWDVDGSPFYLRGRIDRIDVHRDTGEHCILDYKSSDAAQTPAQTHQRRGTWVDLQLPLYRHLARTLEISEPVRLGYMLLPKEATKAEFCLAEWTEADLTLADEVAREVIRHLRAEDFWPPAEPPPDFAEDFAAICQDAVFEKGRG